MGVARYWRQQDQRYNLRGARCTICGNVFFPSRMMCPVCHRRSLGKMEKYHFIGSGKVASFTIVHDPAPGYRSQVPYILAVIELDEGDMILGQIVDCPPSDVGIGSEVEMVFRKLSEEGRSGTIQYGYKFRLK
ncbi:MAG: Zn-ribbon domain-containing OB-fold protein [Candidatus Thermoplasmatota archaeon]|nr:Zn-ribbon domain-containing OB-fold protein [Candidatus Thermoplasmatota archaeon]